MAGWRSPSLALMTRSIPWAALRDILAGVGHGCEEVVELLGALGESASPVAASLIDLSVSPALSKALVAAASALDGSGATSPSMTGAPAGDLAGRQNRRAGCRACMSIVTSPISDRVSRGTDPVMQLVPPLQRQGHEHAVGLVGALVELRWRRPRRSGCRSCAPARPRRTPGASA